MSHLSLSALSHRPSVMTSAVSQFSYSSMESISSFLSSPSSFSRREASVAWSEPLCHTKEIVPFTGCEGSTHPIQAQPLPRPPVHSRRDRREQITGLDQRSAHGFNFNIQPKHLQSQLGTLTLYTASLDKMIPNTPALRPPDRDPRVKFNMSRLPFRRYEAQEELVRHVNTKRLQHEQGLPLTPKKPYPALLPPAPQTPIPGESLLGEPDTKQKWELHTDQPKGRFPTKVPKPLRSDASPRRAQEVQKPCVCPSFQLRSKKAQSIRLPLRAPIKRWMEDVHVLPTDRRQQMARSYSRKHLGTAASKGKGTPDHRSTSQTGRQSTSSSCSTRPPMPVEATTMETGRSDGAAGNQTSPDRCALPAGVDLASPPPGTAMTEKSLAATLHFYRRELRKPLPSVSGTKGTEEKLELHMKRKFISGEGSCLRPEAQAGEGRADLPRTQGHQVAPEAPCSEQETRSILDSLIAGQAAHDLQIKHLMEMLSSSRPLAGPHVSVPHVSVCQLCRKAHPGKVKGKKTQETQVSAELHGLRDIKAPHGFDVHSKLSRDQPPIKVCKKCTKLGQKGPAGSAGADLPRRSHGIPQQWTSGDSSESSNHNKMPVVWRLPADRSKTQRGMGKTAPTKQPKM
ncbi:hypothetical protein G0U57_017737, partial [Chelydra serpentina]